MKEKQEVYVAKTACGGRLKGANGYPKALYDGEAVHYCTHAWFRAFEQDPDASMSGEVERPAGED